MPLPVFIAVGLTACAGIAAYAHWLGRSARRSLVDESEALRLFQAACPDLPAREARLATDRHAALVTLENGDAGLLYAMGSKWIARDLPAGSVKTLKRLSDNRLRLILADYTMPRLTVALANESECERWIEAMESTTCPPEHAATGREARA
ncbi:hypothetical protein FHS78_000677 [Parvibaculum indicum]|uniref:hypothetical protein n=1 Tax=Parvibaculum indicum TaxID=562969 RepID=UPI001424752E|nr:hypothetical protein [Parvibaculum indicum]NIJ40407.1 hypothetical protein [Parvibaculum indicum]